MYLHCPDVQLTRYLRQVFKAKPILVQASGSVSVGDAVSVDALYGTDSDGGILWEKPFADKAARHAPNPMWRQDSAFDNHWWFVVSMRQHCMRCLGVQITHIKICMRAAVLYPANCPIFLRSCSK